MYHTNSDKIKAALRYVRGVLRGIKRDHLSAFAAQSAFFLIMAFIPMIFLVVIIVDFSDIESARFRNFIESVLSGMNIGIAGKSINEFYYPKTALLSMTTLITAWSAGKAFKALTEGFHSVMHVCETRNYFWQRFRGLLASVFFALTSALLFLIGVFGEKIYAFFAAYYRFDFLLSFFNGALRKLFVFMFMFIIFSLIYRFVPDWSSFARFGKKRVKMKYFFVGSFVSTVMIFLYTVFFSIYIENYSQLHNLYGSLTTLICVMLWLYSGMYILILGFKLSMYLNKNNKRSSLQR